MTASLQTDTQATAAVTAYQAASTSLRDNLSAYITGLWRSFGEYRNAQMADFIGQAVPVVAGAQQHMASLTSAYLAAHLGSPPVYVNPAAVTGAALRNGVQPAEVYGRPFHTVWRQLGAAKQAAPLDETTIDAAIKSGLDNAISSAVTDIQLTKTHTAQNIIATNRNVVGYRRQLEGARSCTLCIVASTRRYHVKELMPIHPACDCTPVPIIGGENNTAVLDPELLAAVHATVAAQFGADSTAARRIKGALKDNGSSVLYRDVLITHDHSELGPVLGVRGQNFEKLSGDS